MAQASSLPLPFRKSYGVNLTLALLALIPFIVLTTAAQFYESQIVTVIGSSKLNVDIATWLATAGYAFGALLGGDLIQRFPQRRLFLACEAVFVFGSLLVATSTRTAAFSAGTIIEGFTTGLLLVIALPPVVRRFPVDHLRTTAAFIDIAFFGAIALGPLVGGAIAAIGAWRELYAAVAALGLVTFVVAIFTLPHEDPPHPDRRFDAEGTVLGLLGTALPFWAVGNLTAYGFESPLFYAPFGIGAACFIALLLVEYHGKDPISPVKLMWNTLPVTGILASMIGGGAYFTIFLLAQQFQTTYAGTLPLGSGLSFWPQIVGVAVAAIAFRAILATRFLAAFTLSGMLALIVAIALLLASPPKVNVVMTFLLFGLLGYGAGATVAPGLWMAGLSLKSEMIGRIFALVELVRSEANFLMAPIVVKIAIIASGSTGTVATNGFRTGSSVAIIVTAGLVLVGLIVFFGSGARLLRPDLRQWHDGDKPAWESPGLFAALRSAISERRLNTTIRNS